MGRKIGKKDIRYGIKKIYDRAKKDSNNSIALPFKSD